MEYIEEWITKFGELSLEEFCTQCPHAFLVTRIVEQSGSGKGFETEAIDSKESTARMEKHCKVKLVKKQTTFYPEMITIGRAANNDIQLDHQGISKFHAYVRLNQSEQCYYLTDANSTNGTCVNKKQLEPYQNIPLHDNDIIDLGKVFQLRFLSSRAFHSYMKFYKKWSSR